MSQAFGLFPPVKALAYNTHFAVFYKYIGMAYLDCKVDQWQCGNGMGKKIATVFATMSRDWR